MRHVDELYLLNPGKKNTILCRHWLTLSLTLVSPTRYRSLTHSCLSLTFYIKIFDNKVTDDDGPKKRSKTQDGRKKSTKGGGAGDGRWKTGKGGGDGGGKQRRSSTTSGRRSSNVAEMELVTKMHKHPLMRFKDKSPGHVGSCGNCMFDVDAKTGYRCRACPGYILCKNCSKKGTQVWFGLEDRNVLQSAYLMVFL